MALIKCKECGKEISDKSKTCIYCGNPIAKIIHCKECGKEIEANDNRCPNCGCVNYARMRKIVIIASIILLVVVIICCFPKKLQENLWYADEDGKWTYKFSNGDLYFNFWSGRTGKIGTYNVRGNKIFVQEDEAFGACYTCVIKSNKKIVCECDKERDENCVKKTYIVASGKNME